jgi:hypothetical protein
VKNITGFSFLSLYFELKKINKNVITKAIIEIMYRPFIILLKEYFKKMNIYSGCFHYFGWFDLMEYSGCLEYSGLKEYYHYYSDLKEYSEYSGCLEYSLVVG